MWRYEDTIILFVARQGTKKKIAKKVSSFDPHREYLKRVVNDNKICINKKSMAFYDVLCWGGSANYCFNFIGSFLMPIDFVLFPVLFFFFFIGLVLFMLFFSLFFPFFFFFLFLLLFFVLLFFL